MLRLRRRDKKADEDYVVVEDTAVPKGMLNQYFEWEFFRKIDPMFAYNYLVSSNAYFQAELITKTSVKMLLDIMKPFRDEWAGLAKIIVLIIIMFIVIAGIYIFIFHGGVGVQGAVQGVIPQPQQPVQIK